jgi:hypothetical protein
VLKTSILFPHSFNVHRDVKFNKIPAGGKENYPVFAPGQRHLLSNRQEMTKIEGILTAKSKKEKKFWFEIFFPSSLLRLLCFMSREIRYFFQNFPGQLPARLRAHAISASSSKFPWISSPEKPTCHLFELTPKGADLSGPVGPEYRLFPII